MEILTTEIQIGFGMNGIIIGITAEILKVTIFKCAALIWSTNSGVCVCVCVCVFALFESSAS